MAQAPPKEIGNPFDWSEFYWGGFQPSLIGAVPIIDAFSKDEKSVINTVLDKSREALKNALETDDICSKHNIILEDYFVTIHDEYMDKQIASSQSECKQDNDNSSNSVKKDKKQRDEITVVRLWHKDVFIGVRGSGKANPGQHNFVGKFSASKGELISFTKWQD